ncbi:hypothetical protein [Selenomonas bovis]|uniref:hypothetical protein n=1 Tax=Selenomonas bovis TaxID=416586 RepID=UPI003CFC0685
MRSTVPARNQHVDSLETTIIQLYQRCVNMRGIISLCGEIPSLLSSLIIPWQPYINVGAAEHHHIDHVVHITKSVGHVNDADKFHEACGWICIKFSPHPAHDRADGIP